MTASSLPKEARLAQLAQAFSPAAPVNDRVLFAGRPDQIMTCVDSFFQPGVHIGLCGERGVGKTSLANILPKIFSSPSMPRLDAVRVDCNSGDSFNSIWRKVFRGLSRDTGFIESSLTEVDPDEVRYELQKLDKATLIVIDEFDRVTDDEALSLLADTVKTLADHTVDVTLMFVGVATSVEALLGEHESISRNVKEVAVPRMSATELEKILTTGFERVDELSISSGSIDKIVRTAEGLPHFVHLLGLGSGKGAINDDRDVVGATDVARAEAEAVSSHIMLSAFRRATTSPQPDHLFAEVVLACAYARRDALGYFRPSDVRAPLSLICGRTMGIQTFQRHLRELAETRMTLERTGKPRNYVYRFNDPLLPPFAKIAARTNGTLTGALQSDLDAQQHGIFVAPEPPTEPGQMFSFSDDNR